MNEDKDRSLEAILKRVESGMTDCEDAKQLRELLWFHLLMEALIDVDTVLVS